MKITIPAIGLSNRGGDRVTIELANRLSRRGHRVVIIIPRGTFSTSYSIDSQVVVCQVGPHISQIEDWSSILRLVPLITAIPKSDLLIATYYLTAYPAVLAKALRRCKRVVYLIQAYEPQVFGEYEPTFPGLKRHLAEHTYRFDFSQVAISHWLAARVAKISRKNIPVIHPGLDQSVFYPTFTTIENGKKVILAFPSTEPYKGWQDIIAAAKLVKDNCPSTQFLAASRSSIRLNDGIFQLAQPSNDQELAEIYRSAGIYVHAAWTEGFGLAPLEAMACGTPVVAAASEGIREYAVDRENCLLVDPRSPEQLAAAIGEVLSNRDLAQRLRQGGLQTAARFTWERMADEFEVFLQKLLDSN